MARTAQKRHTSNQPFRRDTALKVIIPLGGGSHAWVASPDSPQMIHVATDSEAFVAAVRALVAAGFEDRVRELLADYGWDRQLAFLDEQGAFSSDEEAAEAAA